MTNTIAAVDRLKELRAKRDCAAIERETKLLERDANLAAIESRLAEAEYKLVDPRTYLYDTPGFGYDRSAMHSLTVNDYQDGHFFPFWTNEAEWRRSHGIARQLVNCDETTINIFENLASYVVASGAEYKAVANSRVKNPESLKSLLRIINDKIEDFTAANGWYGCEDRKLYKQWRGEGELFVNLERFEETWKIDVIPQANITEPDPSAQRLLESAYGLGATSWTYGIPTNSRTDRPLGYYVQWGRGPQDWDFFGSGLVPKLKGVVPELLHFKRNVPSRVKRGATDIFATADRLRRTDRVYTNTLHGAAVQSSIGLIRKVDPKSPGPYRALGNTSKVEIEHEDGSTETIELESTSPGKILDVKGVDVEFGPMGKNNSPDYIAVGQTGQTLSGLRWCFPEYMSTGVSDDVNHAASLTAESPFMRSREADQSELAEQHRCILWKMLELEFATNATLRRLYPGMTMMSLKRLVSIEVETPDTSIRDKNAQTDRYRTLHDAEILSRETWSAYEQLDHTQEQERIDNERKLEREREPDLNDRLARAAADGWKGLG